MWKDEFEKLWEKVLKKSNHCGCNRDKEQQKIDELSKHKLLNEILQKKYFVDECGNPYKINLKDLYKILQKEIV